MNPHDVVPTVDALYLADQVQHVLLHSTTTRLLHTHLPYSCLPEAVRNSGCKFVHVARNPKDTYEELCRDPKEQVRKLASFLGKSFDAKAGGDDEEEEVVMVMEKAGQLPNSHFFRKGTVGDWKNYLTPQMAERIDQLTQLKLQGTGLSLDDF
ncbi:unnamed protein product [Linum tenue]|uniref:Sulfotransferase n=1 Tax=Linum tenue TaxID=586396 RepID=A0AAV0GZ27_9ROSI|nr:unnamed protein product [Linum tenue]